MYFKDRFDTSVIISRLHVHNVHNIHPSPLKCEHVNVVKVFLKVLSKEV